MNFFEVTDTKALARVLDTQGLNYEIVSETKANIYEKINLSQLVLNLSKENCELLTSHERDESLENYFINLVGGGENDYVTSCGCTQIFT